MTFQNKTNKSEKQNDYTKKSQYIVWFCSFIIVQNKYDD